MSRFPIPAVLLLLGQSLFAQQPAGEYHTAPLGPGGTWNVYQPVMEPLSWVNAKERAESMVFKTGGKEFKGHLVTVTSAPESSLAYRIGGQVEVWAGLTDSEKFGGKEALGSRTEGWHWLTGEPVSWTRWNSSEPNNAAPNGKGEDAMSIGKHGYWNDAPNGFEGQEDWTRPFVVEWETAAKDPVPEAQALAPILPKKWKLDFEAPAKKGAGPWAGWVAGLDPVTRQRTGMKGRAMGDVIDALLDETSGAPAVRFDRLHFHWPVNEQRVGWFGIPDEFPHPVHDKPCGALYTTTLRLPAEQVWTFLISCDDFAAVRIPGLKWTAAHGDGFIDPLDPECLCREVTCFASFLTGTVKIPAGDHRLEVVWGNSSQRCSISIAAAQGEFARMGDTDKWRAPGYKAKGELAWPGISGDGWKIMRTEGEAAGDEFRNYGLPQAAEEMSGAKEAGKVDAVHFIDDASPTDQYFPGGKPLPGDPPGQQDRFAVSGDATLEIPQDGIWHIGFSADRMGAMIIEGVQWQRFAANIQDAKMSGESIRSGEAPGRFVTGEVELKKGAYPIHFLYVDDHGPVSFSVFGAPAGYPPRLLRKGGALKDADVDGIPLAVP